MRMVGVFVLLASWMPAQPAASSGPPILRGVLLERDPQTGSGEFSVRAADNHVYRYRFDPKTYVERDSQMIDVARLRPGEKVEVISDAIAGLAFRYARTVQVLEDAPPVRTPRSGRFRADRDFAERTLPFGTLSYSGAVSLVAPGRLVLHTRDGDQAMSLRSDTRYIEDGDLVDAAALKPNMRVFVRAGKDLYGEVEAYQVIWGRILDPPR